MSTSEIDVSWEVLRRIAREVAGSAAEVAEVRPLSGGSVSTTVAITLADGGRFVLKLSPHRVDRSYPREAAQLDLFRSIGLPVPNVIHCKLASLDDPLSYLALEYVDATDLGRARAHCSQEEFDALQADLADKVLTLHRKTGDGYRRLCEDDATPAPSWPAFFESAYAGSWTEVERSPLTTNATRKKFGRIHAALPKLLAHNDAPRLVHDDLWASNILCRKTPEGWRVAALIDPHAKYAHHECELAYLELFGTVTPAFLKRYKSHLRPSDAYHTHRKQTYQLFFLMDHAAYFGGHYHTKFADAAAQLADRI